jgi:transcriptional regulator with PAS, ATPase and Fis domain
LLDIRANLLVLRDLISGGDRQPARRPPADREQDASTLSLDGMERQMIQSALERHEGNRRLAARDLNISERTLYRKIKEYGLSE